eukprot:scaffold197249_cov36-Prasinocladus_malaysianus.AAC.1
MASALSTVAIVARPAVGRACCASSSRRVSRTTHSLGFRPAAARRSVVVRAADGGFDAEEFKSKASSTAKDLKAAWEATEEKPAAIALAVAGFVAVWASAGVVSAVDHLPVVGDLFELIGLVVTGWFIYRYLLFGPDRAELKDNIDSFLSKVAG